jgi:VWFA-related protein
MVMLFPPLRQFVCSLLLALVLVPSVCAQTPSAEDKFTAHTELVTVPTIVTGKSGAHIHDLSKEDFVLLQDGKPQEIAVFEEIQRPATPMRRPAIPPAVFSNVLPGNTAPRQLTILVLDLINTPFTEQAKARHALLEFLQESVDRGQSTALLTVTSRGIRVVRDFTADPALLSAALKKVNGTQPLTEITSRAEISDDNAPSDNPQSAGDLADFAAGKQDELQESLESFELRVAITITMERLELIASAYGGLPGRKALVWVGSGFPFSVSPPPLTITRRRSKPQVNAIESVLPSYDKAWKELNEAQIAVYPVDVRGLTNYGFVDASKRITSQNQSYLPSQQWLDEETINTFRTFAKETGGIAFYNTNDLKSAFEQSADDNGHYYLLGYYLSHGEKKGWHKLNVKVKRENTEVRARAGFLVAEPVNDPVKSAQMDIQTALGSPLDYTAIPLTAQWEPLRPADNGKKKAIFVLSLAPNSATSNQSDQNHLIIDIAAAALTDTGASAAITTQTIDDHLKPEGLEQLRLRGMGFKGFLTVAPGDYTVRFVVRDRFTGRIGSVAAPLTVAK